MDAVYAVHYLDFSNSTSIRLLSLLRDTDEDTIRVGIQVFLIESASPYTALSYAWGPPDPSRTVLVHVCDVRVPQNPFDFLKKYRRRDKSGFHWIDSTCINETPIPSIITK